ncbi:hypothetical protein ACQCN2_17205 [Brevibacillus ginsengisoli]|uniref:hypothetical protein n=1 Tax=Brevibacillus ginsengisoli TaxID=363854 RepID=UPI003CEF52CA
MFASVQSWRQRWTWGLIITLLFASVLQVQPAKAASGLEKNVLDGLKKTVKFYAKSNHKYEFGGFDWELIGLAAAGEKLETRKWQDKNNKTAIDYWASAIKDKKEPGVIAQIAIGLMKNGYDPTNFNGDNLLKRIANSQDENGKMGDDQYTIYNQVLSIIALEMYGYPYDREKATQYLLKRYDKFEGLDNIAFTLNALPFLEDQPGVKELKKSIVQKLTKEQQADGSFIAWGNESVDTTIQVLIGLTSTGTDVIGSPWDKSVKYVLADQTGDGGFQSPYSNGKSDTMTTENALIALATVNEGDSLFQTLTDKEKASLKAYISAVDLSEQIKVYDGLKNYLAGKDVKQVGNTFSISGKELMVRVNVEDAIKQDKPLAILIKAMKGSQVVDTAVVESTSATAQQMAASLKLDSSGTYNVEINYWYGLSDKPEVAKESTVFVVSVK